MTTPGVVSTCNLPRSELMLVQLQLVLAKIEAYNDTAKDPEPSLAIRFLMFMHQ